MSRTSVQQSNAGGSTDKTVLECIREVSVPASALDSQREANLTRRQRQVLDDLSAEFDSGFVHLTMLDLSKRLKCSLRTLYTLAPSRDELVLVVVEHKLKRPIESAASVLMEDMTPLEALQVYLRHQRSSLNEASEEFARDLELLPGVEEFVRERLDYRAEVIRALLDLAVQRGEIPSIDSVALAQVLGGLAWGFTRPSARSALMTSPQNAHDLVVDLMVRGLWSSSADSNERPARSGLLSPARSGPISQPHVSEPLVQVEREGGVMTITLADEDRRNALSAQLMSELVEACDVAEADPSVRVVVLTNRGRVFCAGANLAEVSGKDSAATAPPKRAPDPAALFGRFARSSKPYVGRIAGHCVAGGMGLAAAMDISIAADDAMFGFTEVRIGVAPAVISVVCLPKMSPAEARSAFLRGTRFPAAEAARMGLINAAVASDRLDVEVDAVVEDLLLAGPGAIAASKQLLARVPSMDRGEAFAWARSLSSDLFRSDEAAEGMRAFREKRPPSWAPSADKDSSRSVGSDDGGRPE